MITKTTTADKEVHIHAGVGQSRYIDHDANSGALRVLGNRSGYKWKYEEINLSSGGCKELIEPCENIDNSSVMCLTIKKSPPKCTTNKPAERTGTIGNRNHNCTSYNMVPSTNKEAAVDIDILSESTEKSELHSKGMESALSKEDENENAPKPDPTPTVNLPIAKHPLYPCCNGKEKQRLKRVSLNVNPILGEYDAVDDATAMVIHKDEVDNGEGVHHMEAQSNASILSVIHTYDFVCSNYRGVTENEWMDIINMFMAFKYKCRHESSMILIVTTGSDICQMSLNLGSTGTIYAYLDYNEALGSITMREIETRKGVYLLGLIILVHDHYKSAYNSMIACKAIGEC